MKPKVTVPKTEAECLALEARADALVGCTEGSPEEAELVAIEDALQQFRSPDDEDLSKYPVSTERVVWGKGKAN